MMFRTFIHWMILSSLNLIGVEFNTSSWIIMLMEWTSMDIFSLLIISCCLIRIIHIVIETRTWCYWHIEITLLTYLSRVSHWLISFIIYQWNGDLLCLAEMYSFFHIIFNSWSAFDLLVLLFDFDWTWTSNLLSDANVSLVATCNNIRWITIVYEGRPWFVISLIEVCRFYLLANLARICHWLLRDKYFLSSRSFFVKKFWHK
jgi:hypothetical protein